jgi:hypothetical protein
VGPKLYNKFYISHLINYTLNNIRAVKGGKLFLSGSEQQPMFKRLTTQFENPMTEVCLLGKAYPIL